jgi:sigma-B regulation protein RsbU (phosphoserine phosphatase)
MRRGVTDFVQKPWDNSRLLQTLRTQIERGRARRRLQLRDDETRLNNRRLKLELEEAREIQQGLLPRRLPRLKGFELATAWQPAHVVSGDFLAAFNLDQQHTALCVADVAGKGLPAALLMSNMQAALKSSATATISPSELCGRLNAVMYANTPLNKFITCFYGLLDVKSRLLTFTNAGHNPPLLVRRNGDCLRLEDGGQVLGAFAHSLYDECAISLHAGDRLLLFTDGLTEARNANGEEFGEQRLRDLLIASRNLGAAELQARILNAVRGFCGNVFHDDAALMVVTVE